MWTTRNLPSAQNAICQNNLCVTKSDRPFKLESLHSPICKCLPHLTTKPNPTLAIDRRQFYCLFCVRACDVSQITLTNTKKTNSHQIHTKFTHFVQHKKMYSLQPRDSVLCLQGRVFSFIKDAVVSLNRDFERRITEWKGRTTMMTAMIERAEERNRTCSFGLSFAAAQTSFFSSTRVGSSDIYPTLYVVSPWCNMLSSVLFGPRRTALALPWTRYRVGPLSENPTLVL